MAMSSETGRIRRYRPLRLLAFVSSLGTLSLWSLYSGAKGMNHIFGEKEESSLTEPLHLPIFGRNASQTDGIIPHVLASNTESFSACLLVMDDNHFLAEWIAYHYHSLPLRFLIIAVDPKSQTSPSPILQQWRDQGMTILEWSDDNFMTHNTSGRQHQTKYSARLKQHRTRQKTFMEQCLRTLQSYNRTWTVLIDSDEYLKINSRVTKRYHLPAPNRSQSGNVLQFLQAQLEQNATRMPEDLTKSPCIAAPRLRFGIHESTLEQQQRGVPSFLNASHFMTLRWRKHAKVNTYQVNRWSKVFLDVSRVTIRHIESVHRPVPECDASANLKPNEQSFFVIHHYLGTWEQFSFRDDARKEKVRSFESYRKYDVHLGGTDDDIRPWVEGFVQKEGVDRAKDLLQRVGKVETRLDSSRVAEPNHTSSSK